MRRGLGSGLVVSFCITGAFFFFSSSSSSTSDYPLTVAFCAAAAPDLHAPENSPNELLDADDEVDMSHARWTFFQAARFFCIVGFFFVMHIAKHCVRATLHALRIKKKDSNEGKKRYKKIAVIGGGIGGCVAAWTLRNTADVTLFEQRPVLGGNAKVVEWPLESDDGRIKTTCSLGTGVLAWPAAYFRHYKALLATLGHETELVSPRFMISDDGKTATYRQAAMNEKWDKDQIAWDNFIATVRRTNNFFNGVSNNSNDDTKNSGEHGKDPTAGVAAVDDSSKSIYAISLLNPCNLLSAKRLAKWHGVSTEGEDNFWDTVVVPLYSSSFLTANMDSIPAVMMPIIDDIITVGRGGVKELETWRWSSQHVFKELAKQIGWEKVRLNAEINYVRPVEEGGVLVEYGISSSSSRNNDNSYNKGATQKEKFDAVIFACSAPSVDALTYNNTAEQGRTTLFNELISNVEYCDHTDFNFSEGVAHTNEELALPAGLRDEILRDRYANYVRIDKKNRGKMQIENTFVLGSWIPDALRAEKETKTRAKFYISYNLPEHRKQKLLMSSAQQQQHHHQGKKKKSGDDVKAMLSNRWAHPALSTLNQIIAAALRMVQGEKDIYFTGQFACLGTGHDISTTYSIVLATHLGAPYPFEKTPGLMRDYQLVQRYMGLDAQEE